MLIVLLACASGPDATALVEALGTCSSLEGVPAFHTDVVALVEG